MKYLLLICLTFNNAFGIDITAVKGGDKVPKDGFFVDPENMQKLRLINEEKKLLEQQNVQLKDLAIIKDDKVKLYKEENDAVYKALSKERTKGQVNGVLGFAIGVLATGLATYAALKFTNK